MTELPVPPPIVADNETPELDPRALDLLARAVVIAENTGWDAMPTLMFVDSAFNVLDVIVTDMHPVEICRLMAVTGSPGSDDKDIAAALMVCEGYELDKDNPDQRTGEEVRTFTLAQRDRNTVALNIYRFHPQTMWIEHIEGRVSDALESILTR